MSRQAGRSGAAAMPTAKATDLITINGRPVRRGSAVCWHVWRKDRWQGFRVAADGPDGKRVILAAAVPAGAAQELLDRVNKGKI